MTDDSASRPPIPEPPRGWPDGMPVWEQRFRVVFGSPPAPPWGSRDVALIGWDRQGTPQILRWGVRGPSVIAPGWWAVGWAQYGVLGPGGPAEIAAQAVRLSDDPGWIVAWAEIPRALRR